MNFQQALTKMASENLVIRRSSWATDYTIKKARDGRVHVYVKNLDLMLNEWKPKDEDRQASDWVVAQ